MTGTNSSIIELRHQDADLRRDTDLRFQDVLRLIHGADGTNGLKSRVSRVETKLAVWGGVLATLNLSTIIAALNGVTW